jgi:hypothetical protein
VLDEVYYGCLSTTGLVMYVIARILSKARLAFGFRTIARFSVGRRFCSRLRGWADA